MTKFLTEGTDRTPEQLDTAIDDYEMPDPLEDQPVDDWFSFKCPGSKVENRYLVFQFSVALRKSVST